MGNVSLRLEELEGFIAEGDVIGVNEAISTGRSPVLVNALDWLVPDELLQVVHTEVADRDSSTRIGITDELIPIVEGVALLRPPSLVLGVSIGTSVEVSALELHITDTLATAGLCRSSVATVATMSRWARSGPLAKLGLEIHLVDRPDDRMHPTEAVALDTAGPGAKIVVAERAFGDLSLSIARRRPTATIDLTGTHSQEGQVRPTSA